MKNIIFGVFIEDCDIYCTSYAAVFGDKETWEKTKDPKKSLIYEDNKDFVSLLESMETEDGPFYDRFSTPDEILFPVMSDTVDYDGNDDIPEGFIKQFEALGFEYSEEFGERVDREIVRVNPYWTSSPEYLKVIEIVKNNPHFEIKHLEGINFSDFIFLEDIKGSFTLKFEYYPNCTYPSDRVEFRVKEINGRIVDNAAWWTVGGMKKETRDAFFKEIIKEYEEGN